MTSGPLTLSLPRLTGPSPQNQGTAAALRHVQEATSAADPTATITAHVQTVLDGPAPPTFKDAYLATVTDLATCLGA